ncbi:MAG: amino acid ABC transporter permease [Planctomycetes bacterium]|nr:amino acid ABC transporter permease [Planctomycetota bacterium]
MNSRQQQGLVLRLVLYGGLLGTFLFWLYSLQSQTSYPWDWPRFFEGIGPRLLISGLWLTIQVAGLSLCVALPLGIGVGLLRVSRSRDLRWLGAIYVELIRGTPLLVQVMLWYFFIGRAFGLESFGAAVAALSCFTASYIAEIVRAGIESIDSGQMEAARSLGLTHAQAMQSVILPQAIRRILPPLASEFVALVKDSSLASVVGLEELTKRATDVQGRTYQTFEVWIVTAVLYLVVNISLSFAIRFLEAKTKTGKDEAVIR